MQPSVPASRSRGGTFRALRHRNYRLWFIGQTISLVGTWMQTMAQQVLVYRLTGSAAALGLISFIGLIPLIPFSFWAGSIADRLPKRSVILVAQGVMLAQAVILGILTWTGTVQIWHVYVLAFVLGAANAVDLPARQAFTVEMVEGREDLTNAIGLNSAMFNTARALGPALAGVVVAVVGEGPAFMINAATFLAVILSLLFMRDLPRPRPSDAARTSGLAHMAGGLRYVSKQPVMQVLISLVAVSAFLSMPYSTLAPVFADRVLKQSSQPVIAFICDGPHRLFHCVAPEALPLGMLLAAVGVGAVVGALVVASLPPDTRRGRWMAVGNLGFPLLLLFYATSTSFLVSLAILFGVGWMFVLQNSLANTLIQLTAPDEVRGRVMALYTMTIQGMMRLGGLQAGLTADWLGPRWTVGIGAAISLAYGAWVALRRPVVRKL